MTDWITKTAEALFGNIDDLEGLSMHAGQIAQDPAAAREEWVGQVRDLIARHAPAWHPRPTCPGLWVCDNAVSTFLANLAQSDIDAWSTTFVRRVYGPIPEPAKESP